MLLRPFLAVAVVVGLSAPACAQASVRAAQNCSGVFRATVQSGKPHPHLNACSDRLAPEIARVVREAARNPRPEYLARVYSYASAYRDPAIAREALALAGNAAVPEDAQLLGWFLATAQLRRSLYLRSLGDRPEDWFGGAAQRCTWGDPTDVEYFRDSGLSPGFALELGRVVESVSQDALRPAAVRVYARCLGELLPALTADGDAT